MENKNEKQPQTKTMAGRDLTETIGNKQKPKVGDKRRGEDFIALLLAEEPKTFEAILESTPLAGQRGLSESNSADTLDVTSKDTPGRRREYLTSYIDGSVTMDGIEVYGVESLKTVKDAFEKGTGLYYVKVDTAAKESWVSPVMVSTYDFEAPYDDAATYSIELTFYGAEKFLKQA